MRNYLLEQKLYLAIIALVILLITLATIIIVSISNQRQTEVESYPNATFCFGIKYDESK